MKALVTGASGFVGGYLGAHLGAEGDEVVGLDRDDGLDITDRRASPTSSPATRPRSCTTSPRSAMSASRGGRRSW